MTMIVKTSTGHGPIKFSVDQGTIMGKVIDVLEEHSRTVGYLILDGERIFATKRVRDLQLEAGDTLDWHGVMLGD